MSRLPARLGALAAASGAAILLVSTTLHPFEADPADATAAFAEYARDPLWVWSHIGLLAGVLLLGFGVVGLAALLEGGPGPSPRWPSRARCRRWTASR